MAGIITHMVIAKEISKRLPSDTIQDMKLFYLGNFIPDAVHAREDYIREYKKHTHFREDILDRDFAREDNRTKFHNRMTQFIKEYQEHETGPLDLYRGYVAHNLTDELYLLTLRQDFVNVMEKQGIDQSDSRFFESIITDMSRNDLLLVKNYDGMEEIRQSIEKIPINPVQGYVKEEEVAVFRNWILNRYFYQENEFLQPIHISYENTMEFIDMAADNIIRRLSDDESFPRMF